MYVRRYESVLLEPVSVAARSKAGETGKGIKFICWETTNFIVFAIAMESTQDNINLGSDQNPPVIYRCKKCRRIVATEDHIVPHKRGEGQKCFKWKKRGGNLDTEVPECSSIFVEPMKWMQAVEEGCVEDKLQCFGCKARLGSFNWAGMQCNCGTWINPAFQLHKSRIDDSRV